MGDSLKDFNWIDLCGEDKQLLNSCASILDSPNVEELQMFFESVSTVYHVSKLEVAADITCEIPPSPSLQRAPSSVSGGLSVSVTKNDVELVVDGSKKLVTNENRGKFVQLYAEMACLNGCIDSIMAMRRGLLRAIPLEYLSLLCPVFLMKQVRGEDIISVNALREVVSYESGYSLSHPVIRMFWHMIEHEFSADDIRRLLLFWTGNSVAPSDGFRDEQDGDEKMVISKMTDASNRDDSMKAKLPEASTCDKHLYLPVYQTLSDMRTAIRAAIVYSCLGYDRL